MQVPVIINGKKVLIDEMIQEIIPLFNELGYTTTWSCEGHLLCKNGKVDERWVPYISFSNDVEIDELKKLLNPNVIYKFDEGIGFYFSAPSDDVLEFNQQKNKIWKEIKEKLLKLKENS